MRDRLMYLLPIVAGTALGMAILLPVAARVTGAGDQSGCGVEGNTVEASVELAEARDVWKVLPALGISPELEDDKRPARLIVFEGDYDPSGIQFAGQVPDRMKQVICVIQDDGTINLYMNVSRSGSEFSN